MVIQGAYMSMRSLRVGRVYKMQSVEMRSMEDVLCLTSISLSKIKFSTDWKH